MFAEGSVLLPLLAVVASYLIGSLPCGLILGKMAGVDVRKGGSGNIGATNVARQLGRPLGLLTLIGDAAKAVLPMLAASWLLAASPAGERWVLLCGGAAFLGHLYPLYLGFRGGKGVATALGIYLYLAPLAALVNVAIFAAVVYNWGYVSLGSLTAALLMPGLVWLLGGSLGQTLLALFIGAMVWLKHRDNIERLRRGEEKSWRRKEDKP